jgi:hypothetical protein
MSTCAQIVRGPAARMGRRAANDDVPSRSPVMTSRLGLPAEGVIAALSMDRALFRLDRELSGHPHPRTPHDGG